MGATYHPERPTLEGTRLAFTEQETPCPIPAPPSPWSYS